MSTKTQFPDPLAVAADVYSLLMENDRVRVFDVRFRPGQKAVMHGHPDHVIYVLADGALKLTLPDDHSQEVPVKAGQVLWMDAGPHAAENVGTTEAHLLVVELKESQKEYARVPTFKMSAEAIDAAALHFRDVTVPRLRELPGFKGATLLVNRKQEMTRAIVYWDSRATLDSSFEPTRSLRAEYTEKFGGELASLEEFEVAVEL